MKKSRDVNEARMSVRHYEAISLIALYALSVAIKLVWVQDAPGPTLFFDELIYRQQAFALFQGETFPSAHYPMGYPLLLSGAFGFANWYGAMHVLNALVSSLVIPASWFLARSAGVRWALAPALLCALLPIHAIFPRHIMSENLFVPVFVLAFALALRGARSGRREALLLGIVIGVAHITKYLMLPAVPLLVALGCWARAAESERGTRYRAVLRLLIPAVTGYGLVMTIWFSVGMRAGFDVHSMLGLQISGLKAEQATWSDLGFWVGSYGAYFWLMLLPVGCIIGAWVMHQLDPHWRAGVESKDLRFAVALILTCGGFVLLAIQHSFGASYNYPEPVYIIGRYLMHLLPLLIVAGILAAERLVAGRERLVPTLGVCGVIAYLLPAIAAWLYLYSDLWIELPGWFAAIPLYSTDLFVLKAPIEAIRVSVLAVGACAVLLVLARYHRSAALVLSILVVAVSMGWTQHKSAVEVSERNQSARHARVLASKLQEIVIHPSEVLLLSGIDGLKPDSLHQGLQFWEPDLDRLEVQAASTIGGRDLDGQHAQIFLVHRGGLDLPSLLEYQVRGTTFSLYPMDGSVVERLRPRVESYGPKSIAAGSTFNVQPSGDFALWVKLEIPVGEARVWLDGHALATTTGRNGNVMAAGEPAHLSPARVAQLQVEDVSTGLRSDPVPIEFVEASP